jgi:hypothetical protein
MAQETDSLAFRFAVVLASVAIILVVMTFAPQSQRMVRLRRSRRAMRFTGLNIRFCTEATSRVSRYGGYAATREAAMAAFAKSWRREYAPQPRRT